MAQIVNIHLIQWGTKPDFFCCIKNKKRRNSTVSDAHFLHRVVNGTAVMLKEALYLFFFINFNGVDG